MVTLCRKGALSVAVLITTGAILHRSWGRPSLEYTYPAAPASQLKVRSVGCWLIISSLQCCDCSLWGGSQSVWSAPHGDVRAAHHLHHAFLSLLHRQSGPGVRESRHLQTRPAAVRRSPGPGSVLHHPLCGCLREDRYEESDIWNSATGGYKAAVTKPSCCCHLII